MAGTVDLITVWDLAEGWLAPLMAAPFIGSFAGVLIARIPAGRDVVAGRSACDACHQTLGAVDLVPIASFVALRGKCRSCGARIPAETLAVECAALAIALWAVETGERGLLLWFGCALGWILLTLGWIDARCQRLPDRLTLPLLLAGLAEADWLEPDALTGRALGAASAYGGFRLLAFIYVRLRGREGLGRGDAKLLAAGGAWVGAGALPGVLLIAACAALLYAVRRFRLNPAERIPFGPFLSAGIWLAWLYG